MMAGLVTRLRLRLNGGQGAVGQNWQSKFEALRAKVRARKGRDQQHLETLKEQSRQRARRVPSVEALRHMLVLRFPQAQRRAELIAPQAPGPTTDLGHGARRTVIDGLTWWVPMMPRQSLKSIERTVLKQRFPYRTISQTRDVTVGGIMLDIGANVGRMAVPRVVLGDVTRAFCAEPDERNYECLVANIRDNKLAGLVIPDRVAITDHIGRVAMHREKMPGGHRVDYTAGAESERATVPAITLDAWVERHQIPLSEVTFVKVDTQGSEVHVLSGASQVLAQPQIAWQLEISPVHLRLAGSDPEALYRILTDRFTHFYDLNPEADGPRVRPIVELRSALAYLERSEDLHTDVVVYRSI
jgi:FkbM family methyltransferase